MEYASNKIDEAAKKLQMSTSTWSESFQWWFQKGSSFFPRALRLRTENVSSRLPRFTLEIIRIVIVTLVSSPFLDHLFGWARGHLFHVTCTFSTTFLPFLQDMDQSSTKETLTSLGETRGETPAMVHWKNCIQTRGWTSSITSQNTWQQNRF